MWVISNTFLVWLWSASLFEDRKGRMKESSGRLERTPRISAAILKERQDTMIKLQKLCSKYSRAPVWNVFEAKFSCPSGELTLCSSVCFDCAKEKLQAMQIMASECWVEINWARSRNVNVSKISSGFKELLWKFTDLLSLSQAFCWGSYVKGRDFHFSKTVSIYVCKNRIKHQSVSSLPSPDAALLNYASQWPGAFTLLAQSCCHLGGIPDASLCGI